MKRRPGLCFVLMATVSCTPADDNRHLYGSAQVVSNLTPRFDKHRQKEYNTT